MDWDRQFAEDDDERRERWRKLKADRRAAGKCWQCGKLVAGCRCPNVNHDREAFERLGDALCRGGIMRRV